jgi:hypothetical protein
MMPRTRAIEWVLCAWVVSAVGGPVAWPQQPGPGDAGKSETKKSDRLHEVYLQEASEYNYFLDEPKQNRLELRREPVFRWTSDGDFNGEVYVWTHQGVPGIVGCIFSGPRGKARRTIFHEFHSLSPGPLFAGERHGSAWLPQEAGIAPEIIRDAPEPANTPPRRLTQMRDLARRFGAQVAREDGKNEMRLLPQPLFRYEIADERSPVVDGALFAFVWTVGTDPEAILAIEARRTDAGVRWHYAIARFTNCEAWVMYQGKKVWHADPATVGIFDGVTTKRYGAFSVKTISNPETR